MLSFTLLRNLGNLLAIIIINNFFRCIKGCLLIISCKKIFPKILRFKKNLTNFSTNPNWKKKISFSTNQDYLSKNLKKISCTFIVLKLFLSDQRKKKKRRKKDTNRPINIQIKIKPNKNPPPPFHFETYERKTSSSQKHLITLSPFKFLQLARHLDVSYTQNPICPYPSKAFFVIR